MGMNDQDTRPLPPEAPRWKTILGILLVVAAVAAAISLIVQMLRLVLR